LASQPSCVNMDFESTDTSL